MNFNLSNVIKYVTRAGKKPNEDALTALLKAKEYLEYEINHMNPGLLIAQPKSTD